jgi:pimeloyl-ACP methyl ester carboxylesterase
MAKIYLIPGLGTDVRIFSKLKPLLNEKDIECLEYNDPEKNSETIAEYADRLIGNMKQPESPPVLIGMSLGGAVATEMSHRIPNKKLVIISSYKHRSEVPFIFKIARLLPLYLLVPAWYIRMTVPFLAWLLRICNKEEAAELKEMLYDRTAKHFAWGRRAIVKWNNDKLPENFIHINGSKDHIFRKANKNATHIIKGGTHNMVVDRAPEIADIINREVLV